MNWEETVMPTPSHSESIVCPHCGEEFGIESEIESIKKAQAKRTGEAYQVKIEQAKREGYLQAIKDYNIDTTTSV